MSTEGTKRRVKLLSHKRAKSDLGDVSWSKYYADLVPELDIVRFGRRSFVTDESVDRLIDNHRVKPAAQPTTPRTRLVR